jgi:hypothetical protein
MFNITVLLDAKQLSLVWSVDISDKPVATFFWHKTAYNGGNIFLRNVDAYLTRSRNISAILFLILWRVVPLRQQPYKFWGIIYF